MNDKALEVLAAMSDDFTHCPRCERIIEVIRPGAKLVMCARLLNA